MKRKLRAGLVLVLLPAGLFFGLKPAVAAEGPLFEKDVRPILKAHCFQCHGEGDQLAGKLDLRLRRLMAQGGKSGAAISAGKPDASLLLKRLRKGEMPPGEKTEKPSAAEIAVIEKWIAAGAKTARAEPDEVGTGLLITNEDRAFWAFQPIVRPPVPQPKQADQVRTPIDAFLLMKLQERKLGFTAEAGKATLIRRVHVDLLGLPPTPEDVKRFLGDDRPDAYERLVERLLASPHYGERWGRHWLDVAGYADSEGYTNDDTVRKYAYKYRDYVINSLNADKPFDAFIQEQLAGDELVAPPYKELQADQIEKLVATGYLRMAPDGTASGGINKNAAANQVMAETIKIVSTSLLGMTVGCAQCHNHRYDPIPQSDYYRLRAIFEPAYDWKNWRTPQGRLLSLYTDADREKAKEIEKQAAELDKLRTKKQQDYIEQTFQKELAKLPAEIREPVTAARNTAEKKRTPEQKKLLKEHPSVNVTAGSLYLYDRKAADDLKKEAERAKKVRETKPVEEFIRILTESPGKVPDTFLFSRGDHEQPKEKLTPASLTIVNSGESAHEIPINDSSLPSTGRRLAYARHLTSRSHPLTARVLVNRVWMHHFGRGIVATPGDFGALGEKPTHPALLDWLAAEFMENGWSLKRLHRLMLTSTAYRQALRTDPAEQAIDPDNRLFGQMTPRRLEAEVLRDSILAVSGTLNFKRFGPPVPVMADKVGQFVIGIENLNAGRPGAVISMKGEESRRSVYVQVRRSRPLGVLDTFDHPAMSPNCEMRASSTVAPQALMLMNSDFVVAQSEHFAARVQTEAGDDQKAQVNRAWQLTFARQPDDQETNDAVAFLAEQTKHFESKAPKPAKDAKPNPKSAPAFRALASLCQTLLSANEFLYVD